MKRSGGKCVVTGVSRPELLRASHIKPWSASNNVERLDPDNGLMLSAAYDAAFDARLISFADDGTLILAEDFAQAEAEAAGLDLSAKLDLGPNQSASYLAAHRDLMSARVERAKALSI